MFKKNPGSLRLTLRALARLLAYPDAALRAVLPQLPEALADSQALGPARLAELQALCRQLAQADPMEVESRYVDTFDRGRSTSLHLFEHVHGDSRERGPALIDLAQTYERAGLRLGAGELPDHLPVVLEFASTQPADVARGFLGEMAHILNAIFSALLARRNPYASVIAAILEVAGQQAQPVPLAPEPGIDESWDEPAAFEGCSQRGQAKPGQPQPLHFVRNPRAPQGASV
ncbi:MAG: nitrate reductase molybdenum cofactor assembly chaperone [Burkholderiaceae bacterium]|nr:nitrate reductase molybdenum cofactor assembly chaperone [Burkholderiaceae bacterium]